MTTEPSPNFVRIESLATWDRYFHPDTGIFRLRNVSGYTVEHLDIDLRLVNECHFGGRDTPNDVYLPLVCKLTLRGGEFCQDDDKRVDCLVEVLSAINPVEVRWLHAKSNVDDTFSLSTHMVHHGIIRAGQSWTNLKKLTVQGGYPCPNLTAPTPYVVTPAHTPLPSPGLHKRSFHGLQALAAAHAEKQGSIPMIPSYRSKQTDPAKVHERAERKRLADYALKPRFQYAFGPWAPEELRWSFEGRYTPAAVTTIITNLFKSFSSTFPSSSLKDDRDLPSLLAFRPIPLSIISALEALPTELHLEDDVIAYLQDVTFISVSGNKYARLFDHDQDSQDQDDDRERMGRRMKAELHLTGTNDSEVEIVSLASITGIGPPAAGQVDHLSVSPNPAQATSPAQSYGSLSTEETYMTDIEPEAVTPELHDSMFLEPGIKMTGYKSRSASLATPVEGKPISASISGLNMTNTAQ